MLRLFHEPFKNSNTKIVHCPNSLRNYHDKFEIDRLIPTCPHKRKGPPVTDGQLASLLKRINYALGAQQ